MNNNGIEDILIGASYNNTNNKKRKNIIIILILLVLILIGIIIAYFYTKKNIISPKEAFIKHMSNVNIHNILSNNIYEDLYSKITTSSYESSNNLKFSTNFENENIENIDESKFLLDGNIKKDINKNKTYGEFSLIYSGNDIFKLNTILDKNEIALFSEDISDKYIGIHYDKIKDVFGIDYDSNKINSMLNTEKIDLSKDNKNEYLKKYMNLITTNLSEEQFTIQENFLMEKNSETITVTANTLTLTQEQLKDLLVKILEEFKNDEELLKSVTEESKTDKDLDNNAENNIQNENIEDVSSSVEMLENITKILLGRKINLSLDEAKQLIEQTIQEIKKINGKGLTITIYTNEENIEKIAIVLPEENTLDIEFLSNKENENNIKITYLYKNDSIFNNNQTDYSKEDIETEEKSSQNQTNGFSLEFKKIKNTANTTIDLIYNFIENEKINKKISININTSEKDNSNNYKNDVVITFLTDEGETKFILGNNINFNVTPEIEELKEENCVFLDNLSPEELNQTKQDLTNKILELYSSKIEEFDFLDANIHASKIDEASLNITRNEAKQALIDKVSVMMREALDRNEEFTLQNLVDLKIDGYEVSSNVTENEAIIVVDVYTFKIDSEFILTDVE